MNVTVNRQTLDYKPCRYGTSKLLFRGPPRNVQGDYVAFLGGAETFGRCIESPFPELVEHATGITAINLGCLGAGIDAFYHSPGLIELCSMAQVTVIQILGAPNMSNRHYTVDTRHNDRFLRASRPLKDIFPEVDFAAASTTADVLAALARAGGDRLSSVRRELQDAWVGRMRALLDRIEGRKVLLWLADHPPYSAADGGTICRDPLFVDRAMLNAVRGSADALVEVVARREEIAAGRGSMVIDPLMGPAARTILGPVVHARAAEALAPVLLNLTGRKPQRSRDGASAFA